MQHRAGPMVFVAMAAIFTVAVASSRMMQARAQSKSKDELTMRGVSPEARALLERADELHNHRNYAGGFDAYMEAVKADRKAADLSLIDRYASPIPLDQHTIGALVAEEELVEKESARHIAALKQYLEIHPNDREAIAALVPLVKLSEAELLVQPLFQSQAADEELYAMRGRARLAAHSYTGAISDLTKATQLDPHNPELSFWLGYAEYEVLDSDTTLSTGAKRQLISSALKELARSEAAKIDFLSSSFYRGLLLKKQAAIETDPAVKSKILADVTALTQRQVAILRRSNPTLSSLNDVSASRHAEAPVGWQRVMSAHGTFEYRLPSSWQKVGFNSFKGKDGSVIEQVYPAAAITPTYCRSFIDLSGRPRTEVQNFVYDNGAVRGCLVVTYGANVDGSKQWRETSFRFATGSGIEDVTIILPLDAHDIGMDAAHAQGSITVVDSVRVQ